MLNSRLALQLQLTPEMFDEWVGGGGGAISDNDKDTKSRYFLNYQE